MPSSGDVTVELPVPGYACQTLDWLALAALHAGEDEQLDAEYAAAMLQDYYGAAASSGSNGSNATAAAQEAEEGGGRRRGQRRRLATAAGGGGDTGDVGGCSLDQKRLGLTLESTFGQAAVTQQRLPAPPPPPPPVVVPPTGFSPFDALSRLSITAVFDGPLAGGTPKGVELYAHCAVPQLSDYGLGTANNGGGSAGIEFAFPAAAAGARAEGGAGPLAADRYLYVATEAAQFRAFFGFSPNFTASHAMAINGAEKQAAPADAAGTDASDTPAQLTALLETAKALSTLLETKQTAGVRASSPRDPGLLAPARL